MIPSVPRLLIYIAVMALVTYLIRMLPLAAFGKQIKSRFVRSFLYYVPYAVLGAMTFPAILYSTSNTQSALAGLAVAIVLAWFRRGLLTVAVCSCVAVYAVELLQQLL